MENITPIDVQSYLEGTSYPASKKDLIRRAKGNGAAQEVIDALDTMSDKNYSNPLEVSEELGGKPVSDAELFPDDTDAVDDDELTEESTPSTVPDDETAVDIPLDDDKSM